MNVVIVEFPCVRGSLACFVREDIVIIDDTFAAPSSIVGLLKKCKSFSVELIFVPVIRGEELVQGLFTLGWENDI